MGAHLPKSIDGSLCVHIDVCPDCNEPAVSHPYDPPLFCCHERERYVPVLFVEAEVTDEMVERAAEWLGGDPDWARMVLSAAFSTQKVRHAG